MINKRKCDFIAAQEEIIPQVSVGVPVESTSGTHMRVVTLASIKAVIPSNKEPSMDSVLVDVIRNDGQRIPVCIVESLDFNYKPGSIFIMHLTALNGIIPYSNVICAKYCCIH